jgi:HSP20 family protein
MSETTGAVQQVKEPQGVEVKARTERPLDRMNAVFEDISRRAFEIFENNGRMFGHDLEDWFKAERELLHPVNVELTETDVAFEMKAEVPGFNEKELEISVEPRRVVIAGKRETSSEQKKGKVVRSEASSEELLRVVELPGDIDTAKVRATLRKNGMLEVMLPKAAPVAAKENTS